MICNYMYSLLMNILVIFVDLLMVLVGVAFLTLLERKVLGYVQYRKGPNKVGMVGIFQPFSDAVKLLSKELFIIYKSNYSIYFICPMLSFMIMLMMWLMVPVVTNIYFMNYSMLLMIILMSISSYLLLFMGWSSNSVYSMLGSLRAVAQILSYEVSFILILMIIMILSESYTFLEVMKWQMYMWNMWFMFPVFLIFYISILAELNRSPMDFVEGESELVSGFNIEYFSGSFALIFLAEYGMILFFSVMLVIIFMNVNFMMFFISVFVCFFVCSIIYVRGLMPRLRYDELMYLCWKYILPVILGFLVYMLGFKFYLMLVS